MRSAGVAEMKNPKEKAGELASEARDAPVCLHEALPNRHAAPRSAGRLPRRRGRQQTAVNPVAARIDARRKRRGRPPPVGGAERSYIDAATR